MEAVRAERPRGREAGFTLVEMLVSLVLLLMALAFAGQLLIESQQALVDSAAETLDNPVVLAVARLRGDVVISSQATGIGPMLTLTGHPAGTVVYELEGTDLVRRVYDGFGMDLGGAVALRGVENFTAAPVAPMNPLVRIEVVFEMHQGRKSPLPTAPGTRGARSKTHTEVMFLLPRWRP